MHRVAFHLICFVHELKRLLFPKFTDMEGQNPRVESSYLFPSRSTLDVYLTGAATQLRKEMKEKFLDSGKVIEVKRKIGLVMFMLKSIASSS